jgi:catechol 2,3-dioxygenase-like lactoylglutathione lyase family enzyme
VDVLSSRILLRPSNLDRSRRFYRDLLGLAIYREFGPADDPGLVFFLGQGLLEVSGHAPGPHGRSVMIWIQVRDVRAEHARLAEAGVPVTREPAAEPWGLTEMWIEDPDGLPIVLVEVPAGHPLRRDPRSALAGSGNPGAIAHQGPPRQLIDLPPGLDPLRSQDQELYAAARFARVPVGLRRVPLGQAGRNVGEAVDPF